MLVALDIFGIIVLVVSSNGQKTWIVGVVLAAAYFWHRYGSGTFMYINNTGSPKLGRSKWFVFVLLSGNATHLVIITVIMLDVLF